MESDLGAFDGPLSPAVGVAPRLDATYANRADSVDWVYGVDRPCRLSVIAFMATVIAVFSASQDVAIDAYRRELLSDELGLETPSTSRLTEFRV